MIITWRGSDQYALSEGERHHIAVVVVGVFADQVNPSGSGPDAHWLSASPGTKCLGENAGVVAHLMHCIGEGSPTTSGRSRGP